MKEGLMVFLPEPLFHFNYLFYSASVFWIFAAVGFGGTSGMVRSAKAGRHNAPALPLLIVTCLQCFAAILCGAVVLAVQVRNAGAYAAPLAVGAALVFALAPLIIRRVAKAAFSERLHSWLRWAFIVQALSALLTAWGLVFAHRSTADLLQTSGYEWLALAGILAMLGAAGGVVAMYLWVREVFQQPGVNRDIGVCVGLLLLVLMMGWGLCALAGAQARDEIRERYLVRARIAALSLPAKLVMDINHPDETISRDAHNKIVGKLRKILRADGQAEYAYLWTIRNGWVTFIADADRAGTEDETPPNFGYRRATGDDLESFQSLFGYFNEPFVDDWGVLVSANEPVWGEDGAKMCWFGIDYPASQWFSSVFNAMTLVFLGSGLAVLTVLFGFGLRLRGMRTQALSLEAERAGAADRAKAEFIASLSHDLRTPLQAIAGCVDLLSKPDAEDRPALMGALQETTATLLRFHEDILDFSALREEMLHIRSEAFDLASLCRSVALNGRRLCQAKGLFFQWSFSRDFPATAMGDPVRLRQILTNLLDNAVKFTSKGTVDMQCSLDAEKRLVFVIEDTGRGIGPERRDIIFEPFERAGAREPGTGLGLAIVKRLTKLLGGSISVAEREGGGSRFVVMLPYQLPGKDIDRKGRAEGSSQAYAGRALILEDQREVRLVFEGYLRSLGWEVKGCENIARAEALLGWYAPHLFLVDVSLPDGSVLEFIRRIRMEQGHARILCVSAATDDETVSAVLEAGADDFLHKPISFDAFAEALSGFGQAEEPSSPLDELFEQGSAHHLAERWDDLAVVVHRMVNVIFALGVTGCAVDFSDMVRQCSVVERAARAGDINAARKAWEVLLQIKAKMGPIPIDN